MTWDHIHVRVINTRVRDPTAGYVDNVAMLIRDILALDPVVSRHMMATIFVRQSAWIIDIHDDAEFTRSNMPRIIQFRLMVRNDPATYLLAPSGMNDQDLRHKSRAAGNVNAGRQEMADAAPGSVALTVTLPVAGVAITVPVGAWIGPGIAVTIPVSVSGPGVAVSIAVAALCKSWHRKRHQECNRY